MAKNKRKTSRTRVKAERMDYRTGGRVGYAVGDRVMDPRITKTTPNPTELELAQQQNVPKAEAQFVPTNLPPAQIPTQQSQVNLQGLQNLPTQEDIQLAAQERGQAAATQAQQPKN